MITIPPPIPLDDRLDDHFKAVRKARRPKGPFRVQIRASSFPICPRKYHIYRRLPPELRPVEEDTFIRDSATLEGTALHMALQKWFGITLPHHAYGNWGCHRCRKLIKHATGIQTCPSCGDEMVYVEYEITPNEKAPFPGHMDMFLRYFDETILVDFKGSNKQKMDSYRLNNAPKLENYLQVNGYANAVNLGGQDVGGIRVDKIVIIYIDRGAPWFDWLPFVMPISRKAYRETLALQRQAIQSVETMTIPPGICRTKQDTLAHWCEAKDLCFSELLDTRLHDKVYPEDLTPQDEVEGLLRARAARSDEGMET